MGTRPVLIQIEGGGTLDGSLSAPDEKLLADQQSTVAIMLHDIPFGDAREHNNLFGFLRSLLNVQGYQSLIFDFQSCGNSVGSEEEFDLDQARENLKSVLAWCRQRGMTRQILIASGVSATLALEAADEDTSMICLFWPVLDLSSHGEKIFSPARDHGRKVGANMLAQFNAYDPATLKKSLPCPIIVHYGLEDSAVAPGNVDVLKQYLRPTRFDITSYVDGGTGLTQSRHRQTIAHQLGQWFMGTYL